MACVSENYGSCLLKKNSMSTIFFFIYWRVAHVSFGAGIILKYDIPTPIGVSGAGKLYVNTCVNRGVCMSRHTGR